MWGLEPNLLWMASKRKWLNLVIPYLPETSKPLAKTWTTITLCLGRHFPTGRTSNSWEDITHTCVVVQSPNSMRCAWTIPHDAEAKVLRARSRLDPPLSALPLPLPRTGASHLTRARARGASVGKRGNSDARHACAPAARHPLPGRLCVDLLIKGSMPRDHQL